MPPKAELKFGPEEQSRIARVEAGDQKQTSLPHDPPEGRRRATRSPSTVTHTQPAPAAGHRQGRVGRAVRRPRGGPARGEPARLQRRAGLAPGIHPARRPDPPRHQRRGAAPGAELRRGVPLRPGHAAPTRAVRPRSRGSTSRSSRSAGRSRRRRSHQLRLMPDAGGRALARPHDAGDHAALGRRRSADGPVAARLHVRRGGEFSPARTRPVDQRRPGDAARHDPPGRGAGGERPAHAGRGSTRRGLRRQGRCRDSGQGLARRCPRRSARPSARGPSPSWSPPGSNCSPRERRLAGWRSSGGRPRRSSWRYPRRTPATRAAGVAAAPPGGRRGDACRRDPHARARCASGTSCATPGRPGRPRA